MGTMPMLTTNFVIDYGVASGATRNQRHNRGMLRPYSPSANADIGALSFAPNSLNYNSFQFFFPSGIGHLFKLCTRP